MKDYSQFIEVIKDFNELFDALLPLEQKKLDAAVKNQVSFVEECINKEQAAVLRLRGLEQRREQVQKALGLEDLTFRQILEEVPEEVNLVLKPLFDTLSQQVRTFQSITESSKDIIEVNLHNIQQAMKNPAVGEGIYSPQGAPKDSKETHFTNRSV